MSSFFSVSKPYFDLGGNSVVITVSKGIRSVMSDVVICFDLALSYRNKFQEALHRKINELDGETVEVECRIPIGAGATCHPETVNPYSRIDPWYLRLRNFLLGSDERAKVRANLTKALQQYIGEAKGELASVCGDLKVLNPKRTPGNPAEPIQFSIPLSSNFMGSPREATFLLAQLNLADFQKQTTLWALAGSLLFGGGFLGLLWVLGNEIGTRREAETAFKKVAYVMSCAPVAYTRLDATDRVVDANQKFLDLLGYSEFAQIRGKALKSFLADRASEIEYEGVQQQRLANKDVLPYDIAFRQRDGTSTIRWVVSADIPASRAGKSDLPETFGIFLQDRPPDPSVP